uniref:Uncharacterized protein n=1 Tax=Trichogramma kaykai TaxID=54128 RepID=A0ABD2XPF5_9HYME
MKFITAATLIVALASVASASPNVEDYRVYYPRLVVRQPAKMQVIQPQPRPQMTFADALSKFANDIAAATNRYNQSMKQQQLSQAQLQAQAQAKAQAKARAKALAQQKAQAEAKAIAVAQAEAEARAQSIAKSKAEREARAQAIAQAQSLAAAESRAKAVSEAKAKAVAEARAKAQALAESRAKAVSQAQAGNAQAKSDAQATSGAGGNAQATSNSAAQSLENINAVIHGNVNVQNGGQVAPPAEVGSASPSEELATGVAETQKLQQADSNGQANAQGGAANAQSTSNSASQSLSGINAIVHGNVNLVNGVNQGGSEGAANGGAGQGAGANAVSNSASQSLSGINAIVHGDVNVVNGGTTGGVVGAASSGAAEGDQGASAQQPGVEKPVPGDDTLQTDSVTPTVANVIVSGLVNLCVKELGVTVGNVDAQGVAEAVSHASSELHSLLDSILNFCQALQGREQLENPVALSGHLGQIKDNNVAPTEASKNNLLNLLGGLVTDGKPDQLAPECVCVTPKIELPEQQQPQVPVEQPQIPSQPEAQEVADIVFPDAIDPTVHKQKQPVLDA